MAAHQAPLSLGFSRRILFSILFHYGLLQDIEYSSLCYTVSSLHRNLQVANFQRCQRRSGSSKELELMPSMSSVSETILQLKKERVASKLPAMAREALRGPPPPPGTVPTIPSNVVMPAPCILGPRSAPVCLRALAHVKLSFWEALLLSSPGQSFPSFSVYTFFLPSQPGLLY